MSRIRGKDTKPEMTVRRLAHALGFRYRLHVTELPGTPDLVFPSRRKVIFVHGCFWHGHSCSRGAVPQTRRGFWIPKLEKNRVRDLANLNKLGRLKWRRLVIWECQLNNLQRTETRIARFLDAPSRTDGRGRRPERK